MQSNIGGRFVDSLPLQFDRSSAIPLSKVDFGHRVEVLGSIGNQMQSLLGMAMGVVQAPVAAGGKPGKSVVIVGAGWKIAQHAGEGIVTSLEQSIGFFLAA